MLSTAFLNAIERSQQRHHGGGLSRSRHRQQRGSRCGKCPCSRVSPCLHLLCASQASCPIVLVSLRARKGGRRRSSLPARGGPAAAVNLRPLKADGRRKERCGLLPDIDAAVDHADIYLHTATACQEVTTTTYNTSPEHVAACSSGRLHLTGQLCPVDCVARRD